jgi:hypothetical protein
MKNLFLFAIAFVCFRHASAQLSANINTTQPTCAQPSGNATVIPTGGSNYYYQWSNGATTSSVSGLAAGSYTVTVYSVTPVFNTVYNENFEATHNWTLNVATGANGFDNNYWVVNDYEGGTASGNCRVQNNSDKTLHITSVFCPTCGAKYDAGGLCGLLYCPETNMAAQSPDISTAGVTSLQLLFDFMANGSGLTDNASLYYSIDGGTNFILLDASLKTANCSGSNGRWGSKKYNLPVSANNISNFKIRFNWSNNDDGVGTDPSVAVNNIMLRDSVFAGDSVVVSTIITPPALPVINASNVTITHPGCGQSNGSITGIAVSGGATPYQVQWTFNGSVYSNSFPLLGAGAGVYTFEVTDANSCTADTTFTLTGQGSQPVTLIVSNDSICDGETATICAPSGAVSYLWNTGATTSCIVATDEEDYSAIVTQQGGCTGISDTVTITTLPLPSPFVLVKGDSLFSNGGVSYQWYFNGNPINGAAQSNHTATQSGDYSVLITGSNGCSIFSDTITVLLTGIVNFIFDENIRAYPVPFENVLYIELPSEKRHLIQFVAMSGKLFFTGIAPEKIFTINTASYPAGVYALILQNDENKKIIRVVKH